MIKNTLFMSIYYCYFHLCYVISRQEIIVISLHFSNIFTKKREKLELDIKIFKNKIKQERERERERKRKKSAVYCTREKNWERKNLENTHQVPS